MRFLYFVFLLSIIACNDQHPIASLDTSEFLLKEGLTIELIAQEPMIQSPVAMAEDTKGRLWVAEMRGYMRDIDGKDEELPDGRIVILEDHNQDGIMDHSTVFIDNIVNPRAVCLIYGGLLYTEGSQLMFADIIDDTPHNIQIVDSMYVVGGNIEHQPNGLFYNIDNWIYSAKSNVRYKRKNGQWLKEATSFRGQWGISSDNMGRLVYNHNSAPLIGDRTMPNALLNNPHIKLNENVGNYYTDDMRLYPIQATAVNRGYEDYVLDSADMLISYTSACSPLIFNSNGLGSEYDQSGFVCAPEANLVSNYKINHLTQQATKDSTQEFLVSKDETFRPVSLNIGLDGSLYIVDMRKGIIQHSAYMTSYLREKILSKKLDQIVNKGRIYRIKPKDSSSKPLDLQNISTVDLPNLIKHPNQQIRLLAQKELIHRNDTSAEVINQLRTMAHNPSGYQTSAHAWYTLDELNQITYESFSSLDIDRITPEFAISILPLLLKYDSNLNESTDFKYIDIYRKIRSLKDRSVNISLAANLSKRPEYWDELFMLLSEHKRDTALIEAIVAGVYPTTEHFQQMAKQKSGDSYLFSALSTSQQNQSQNIDLSPKIQKAQIDDTRTHGLKAFRKYCASCHGYDGLGMKKIAPSLVESEILKGSEKRIASIILNGYSTTEGKYQMMMPAYKNNPEMTDKDISGIVSYLLSTFAQKFGNISTKEIAEIRREEN